ncbi:MAG: DUF4258 domain-containing protein [Flavobacteriales bacterium]|nr:DUF4258 domain-containing protein [Flavobacteriales bacterium]
MTVNFYFTKHALIEMSDENISIQNVKEVVLNGKVIRTYPEDPKGLSRLVLGFPDGRAIHVVCAQHLQTVHVITAYLPSTDIWENDLETKRQEP